MPYNKPTPRQIDTVKAAATQLVAGDALAAAKKLEDFWTDRALDGYQPEMDADEDGPIAPNIDEDVRGLLTNAIETVVDYVADAVYEVNPDGNNDELLNQLEQAMTQMVDAVTDSAADQFKDGVAYSRDPYAYNGVNRSDFF